MKNLFGIDIGGTKISAAYIVDEQIVARSRQPYRRASLVEDISALYLALTEGREAVQRVGVCSAGLIDPAAGVIKFAGNLELNDYPLGDLLQQKLGVEVRLENDARSALWGEFSLAAGRLGANVAGLALGTGVGGALIVGGQLVRGKNGFAGELGHLPVSVSSLPCACGLFGCLETIAGGRQFEANFTRKTGRELAGHEIAALARQGDQPATDAFAELGRAIGEVVAHLDTALDLDTVVIGGGFGATADIWLERAKESYRQDLVGAAMRREVRFVPSELGQDAQILGAALLR